MRDSEQPGAEKLWGGRFSGRTSGVMERWSESLSRDHRLYRQDLAGSAAHARMLVATGIISAEDGAAIAGGLQEIQAEIERGAFQWSAALEDIHTNIEAALTAKIGAAGKRLHTARSRNDQVATDLRLYVREQLDGICGQLSELQRQLVTLAAGEADTLLPGYTHLQPAQPVTLGHHLLAWNEMLQRDYERFQDCRKRLNICPLGSAALAGTSFPIDREMTARELGFDRPAVNSMDAVSDRDFVIEFLSGCALTMVHFSRFAEELVLWSSTAFGFVDLGDGFCTGSSIMPQKKNPDVAELTRGKSARAVGNLTALLTLMKGQPLTYNRDNQEDKAPLFDSADDLTLCLEVFNAMLPQLTFHRAAMRAAAAAGFTTATDLADYLVRQGAAFRDAHAAVGKAVAHAAAQGIALEQVPLETLREFSNLIGTDVYSVLEPGSCAAARRHIGGTAPQRVRAAAADAAKLLAARPSNPG